MEAIAATAATTAREIRRCLALRRTRAREMLAPPRLCIDILPFLMLDYPAKNHAASESRLSNSAIETRRRGCEARKDRGQKQKKRTVAKALGKTNSAETVLQPL